jgi:hypothetical protein
MTALLDDAVVERLARICGMFGSDHDGERASAAAMADKILRQHGVTWPQILIPHRSTIEELISFALDAGRAGILNTWEEAFLRGTKGRRSLTEKQLAKLHAIVAKVKAWRAAA